MLRSTSAEIRGTWSPWRLNFLRWRQICIGLQYGTYLILPFSNVEFWDIFFIFGKRCAPLLKIMIIKKITFLITFASGFKHRHTKARSMQSRVYLSARQVLGMCLRGFSFFPTTVDFFKEIVRNPFCCRGIRVFAWVVDISCGNCAEARDGFEGVENIVRFLPLFYATLPLIPLSKARKSLTRTPRPIIDVLGEGKGLSFRCVCVCVCVCTY